MDIFIYSAKDVEYGAERQMEKRKTSEKIHI